MKTPKYHIYLTNEERSEVLKSLIDLKNALIEQGKYNDVIDEIIVKLSCARKKNINNVFTVPEARTVRELLVDYMEIYGVNKWAMSTYDAKNSLNWFRVFGDTSHTLSRISSATGETALPDAAVLVCCFENMRLAVKILPVRRQSSVRPLR